MTAMWRTCFWAALAALVLSSDPAAAQPCPDFFSPLTTGVVQDPAVNEASGMVASLSNPGVFWLHNDSGDSARAFAVREDGSLLATYALVGAAAVDWEDMARGPGPVAGTDYLYFGDIGDNSGSRSSVKVYRVPEPDVPAESSGGVLQLDGVVALEMEYPDGAHNAETLLVDPLNGDLFIVTKCSASAGCTDGISRVFRYPASQPDGVPATLSQVAAIEFSGGAIAYATTAGDISSSGARIAVRTYTQALLWDRAPGATVGETLSGSGCAIPVPPQIQGETLAFSNQGSSYSTLSEFAGQPIFRLDERGEDQFLLGRRLVVKDSSAGTDGSKRRVVATAREKKSPNTIVGDPVSNGALLEVTARGGNTTTQQFLLSPGVDRRGSSFWTALGSKGYRYRDARGERGPVKKVLLTRSPAGTVALKVLLDGRNGDLDIVPPNPGTDGSVTLRFPKGDRYCVRFGDESSVRSNGRLSLRITGPTIEGCP